jgi:hypothetical protein
MWSDPRAEMDCRAAAQCRVNYDRISYGVLEYFRRTYDGSVTGDTLIMNDVFNVSVERQRLNWHNSLPGAESLDALLEQ